MVSIIVNHNSDITKIVITIYLIMGISNNNAIFDGNLITDYNNH